MAADFLQGFITHFKIIQHVAYIYIFIHHRFSLDNSLAGCEYGSLVDLVLRLRSVCHFCACSPQVYVGFLYARCHLTNLPPSYPFLLHNIKSIRSFLSSEDTEVLSQFLVISGDLYDL